MGKPCRQLSQTCQSVALLFKTSNLTDAVCHHPDEALGQFRHFLNELREQRTWKSQDAAVAHGSPGYRELLHATRKWERARDVAHLTRYHDGFTAELTPPLKFAFEEDKHSVGRITLPGIDVAGLEIYLLRLAEEPRNLVFRQIRKRRHAQ